MNMQLDRYIQMTYSAGLFTSFLTTTNASAPLAVVPAPIATDTATCGGTNT